MIVFVEIYWAELSGAWWRHLDDAGNLLREGGGGLSREQAAVESGIHDDAMRTDWLLDYGAYELVQRADGSPAEAKERHRIWRDAMAAEHAILRSLL